MRSKIFQYTFLFVILFVFGCSKDDDKETPSQPNADLSVKVTVNKSKPEIGEEVIFTITAQNYGPKDATDVSIVDTLSGGLTYVGYTTTRGTFDEGKLKLTIGNLSTKDGAVVLKITAKVSALGSISCKSTILGDVTDNNTLNNTSTQKLTPSITNLTKEQTWSYDIFTAMQEIYLWNDALPASFNPTKYATSEDALDYLKGLKISSSTNQPIDRYSFLDPIGNLSGELGGGVASGDYGFMVTAAYNDLDKVAFFVTYVYKESPAGKAGVKRTYEIIGVNGSGNVNPDVTSDGYLVSSSVGYTTVVNALFSSTSATFTFKRPDGTSFDAQMATASYSINSVLLDSVYTTGGGKKVGYLVFNSFLGTPAVTELTSSITKFQNSGVEYMVVDLRYNGGGSVATCESLCNMLAPSSANGKVMYKYKMNPTLTKEYSPSAMITNFSKTNTFAPQKIYFIVGGGTASASELLINNLKPYFSGSLYLIGRTTYGKPCGFWATPIGYTENQTTPKEGYDLYAVSFETINANDAGGYYAGMTPDVVVSDRVGYAWGDVKDPRLGQALYHIDNGSFSSALKSTAKTINVDLDRHFKGMVDFRKHTPMNK